MAEPMRKPLDFLEDVQGEYPDVASDVAEMAQLYERRLWHQLTLKIEGAFNTPAFNRNDLPVQLFDCFVMDFAHKINLLKLAHFAVHASKYQPSPAQSLDFLFGVISKLEDIKGAKVAEPVLFLKMHVAQYKLETGDTAGAKTLILAAKDELDAICMADPSVSAAVHYVASLYHKGAADFAEFYKSVLTYLSYVSCETLPEEFRVKTAVDISLAALLGEQIYSFGQLLQHPIVTSLDGGPHQWLHEMLKVFNAGDMHAYDELCTRHAAQLNAQPALVAHEARLREKITLMALVEMVSTLPAEERTLRLADVAQRTKLDADGAEFLLMKALSLHLVEGTMDQVAGTVHIVWVQPRILAKPQIQGLKDRLDVWIGKVAAAAVTLEGESVGVVEAV